MFTRRHSFILLTPWCLLAMETWERHLLLITVAQRMSICLSLSVCAQFMGHIHTVIGLGICSFVRNHTHAACHYCTRRIRQLYLHRGTYAHHVVQPGNKTYQARVRVYQAVGTACNACTQTPRGKPIVFISTVVFFYFFYS